MYVAHFYSYLVKDLVNSLALEQVMAVLHSLWCLDIYLVIPLSGKFFLEIT